MNIAIYDTEHFETTYTLIRVFADESNTVAVFTTEEMAIVLRKMLGEKNSGVNWILFSSKDVANIRRIYSYCRKQRVQYLFLNTVNYHHLLFGLLALRLKPTKTIVTVHDANSFYRPKLMFHWRSIARAIGKKLLANTADAFATLLTSTKKYIQDNFAISKPIISIPGSFYEEHKLEASDEWPVIAISGSVDVKRRNYQQVFDLLEELEDVEIEFVLLGAAKDEQGKQIINKLETWASEKLKITTYNDKFVDEEEFNKQLRRCDFVFAPLQKTFNEESTLPEEYGLTKSSGSFFDAVRFGKPLIVSSDITIPQELVGQCIFYKSAKELAAFLTTLTPEEKNLLIKKAVENSGKFALKRIQEQVFSAIHL